MMFGHIASGLAIKPLAPKIPLWVLLVSAEFLDIICMAIFLPLGIERASTDPTIGFIAWSHGLFMSVIWSLLAFAVGFIIFRNERFKTGLIIGLMVFGHWVLDFISHPMGFGKTLPPDMPLLFADSAKIGLGLYQTVPGAIITELVLFITGIVIYINYRKKIAVNGKL